MLTNDDDDDNYVFLALVISNVRIKNIRIKTFESKTFESKTFETNMRRIIIILLIHFLLLFPFFEKILKFFFQLSFSFSIETWNFRHSFIHSFPFQINRFVVVLFYNHHHHHLNFKIIIM